MIRGVNVSPITITERQLRSFGVLARPDGTFCGAVLVTPSIGIVIGRCAVPAAGANLTFVNGLHLDLGETYTITQTFLLPSGIAVFKLATPVPNVDCLPIQGVGDFDPIPVDKELVLIGYGDSHNPARETAELLYATRGIGTGVTQVAPWPPIDPTTMTPTPSTLVVHESRGTETAPGDSGGPWISSDRYGLHIAGLTAQVTIEGGTTPYRLIYITPVVPEEITGAVAMLATKQAASNVGKVIGVAVAGIGVLVLSVFLGMWD